MKDFIIRSFKKCALSVALDRSGNDEVNIDRGFVGISNAISLCARCRGGSRDGAISKMERFGIIVNGFQLSAVTYYHKALHLGCCSSPRSASEMLNMY